ILAHENFAVVGRDGGKDIARGVDVVAESPDGNRMFVTAKTGFNTSIARQTIDEATRLREQYGPDVRIVLATAGPTTLAGKTTASREKLRSSNVEVWDSNLISAKIANIPDLRDGYLSLVNGEHRFAASLG